MNCVVSRMQEENEKEIRPRGVISCHAGRCLRMAPGLELEP